MLLSLVKPDADVITNIISSVCVLITESDGSCAVVSLCTQ